MITNISVLCSFDISRPLMFALMNVSPSHRMRLNVRANAMPLNAIETIRGSPSPWKVWATTPIQASVSPRSVHDSTLVRTEVIAAHSTLMEAEVIAIYVLYQRGCF